MAEEIENIFENAKFGDKFVTRGGMVCSYVGVYRECVKYPYFTKHLVIFENETCTEVYTEKGVGANKFSGDNSDIVSRYQEEIDEEKLDKLAEKLYQEEAERNLWQADKESFFCGVKVGYRQRAKEER